MKSDTDTNSVGDGYELQIGDTIVSKHTFGNNKHTVIRVTKKYAFVKYNDVAEGKYPRVFNMYFEALPRSRWGTILYSIEQGKL